MRKSNHFSRFACTVLISVSLTILGADALADSRQTQSSEWKPAKKAERSVKKKRPNRKTRAAATTSQGKVLKPKWKGEAKAKRGLSSKDTKDLPAPMPKD